MNNCDLNLKLGPLTVKLKLKAEEDKIVQLQTHDLSYFLENNFFWWWLLSEHVYLSANNWYITVKK